MTFDMPPNIFMTFYGKFQVIFRSSLFELLVVGICLGKRWLSFRPRTAECLWRRHHADPLICPRVDPKKSTVFGPRSNSNLDGSSRFRVDLTVLYGLRSNFILGGSSEIPIRSNIFFLDRIGKRAIQPIQLSNDLYRMPSPDTAMI